mgnify:CR=1 FL=1
MRKPFLSLVLVMLSAVTFGQQWVAVKSDVPSTFQTELVASSESQITVRLQTPGFYALEVSTPRGEANVISVPKAVSTSEAGEPNLPMIAIPVLVGDRQHYGIRVVDAQYTDFQMEIAPSKGDFSRQTDPEDVPYTYGAAYSTDAFFPAQNVGLYEPYILRDFRGQNMVVHPFAYNPISKTLRVYYSLTVEMFADGQQGENVIDRRSSTMRMDPEFEALYHNHFINYSESLSKYFPVDETGHLLIICHDAFMDAMQPFVNWKRQTGRPTTMVGISAVGSTESAIKTYIQNQYDANNSLTHVLLVGDVGQIPGHSYSAGSYSGKSDNWYGQVAGDDMYNELIIGRFCAESVAQVTTHVNKVIHYERDIDASDTWLTHGCGVAASAGGGGHFGEDDWQHINNIRDDLMGYNYTTVYQEYYNTSGYNSTTQQISTRVNSGVSIINYCNHGNQTAWQSHSPWYSNSYVNALTNDNKLPIIFSVACLNGQYDYSQACFAETWLRATNNTTGAPTGAVGGMFSYISQPWIPPMYGQDEMVDVLVESYSNNIKRTLGGISFDGNMKILDQYGQNSNQSNGTYMGWILFGDPTLTVRNDIPADMGVTHASTMGTTATSLTVTATNGENAIATLTLDNEIMGSATIANGSAILSFEAPETTGTATLTVFGYNKITYLGTVEITSGGTQNYTIMVSAIPSNGGTVTGGGTFQEGQSCTVSASANTGFNFTNWTENGNVVSTRSSDLFNVTGNRNLVANFTAIPQTYTVTVSANPTNGGTVTGGGTYQEGQSCTVNATAATGYTFSNWTENGNVVSTNANYSFTVTGNRNLVANFTLQQFTITTIAEPGDHAGGVEGGGTYTYGQTCTLTATPCIPFVFVNWTKNGVQVSTNTTYTFQVTESATYVAHFVVPSFTVVASANPTEGGTVTGGGTYSYEECTLMATANEGYGFVNWTENGLVVSTDNPYTFFVDSDHTLVANFELQSFEVKLSVDPTEAGTANGEGIYQYGDEVTLTVDRNEDWAFQYWTEDGEVVSEEMTYTFTITGNRDLAANFLYTVGIGESGVSVKLYPNPAQGEVTLEGEGLQSVRIVNAYGQTVHNAKVEGEQVRIDLSRMAKGVYVMHIGTAKGNAVRQIVVE